MGFFKIVKKVENEVKPIMIQSSYPILSVLEAGLHTLKWLLQHCENPRTGRLQSCYIDYLATILGLASKCSQPKLFILSFKDILNFFW